MLSEQYMNTVIATTDGRIVTGRIVEETPVKVVVRPDPLEPTTITIAKSEIDDRKLSKASPMPEGLPNTFTKAEILDLLAYLESLGDPQHPNFKR